MTPPQPPAGFPARWDALHLLLGWPGYLRGPPSDDPCHGALVYFCQATRLSGTTHAEVGVAHDFNQQLWLDITPIMLRRTDHGAFAYVRPHAAGRNC